MPVFKTGAFVHSATPPLREIGSVAATRPPANVTQSLYGLRPTAGNRVEWNTYDAVRPVQRGHRWGEEERVLTVLGGVPGH